MHCLKKKKIVLHVQANLVKKLTINYITSFLKTNAQHLPNLFGQGVLQELKMTQAKDIYMIQFCIPFICFCGVRDVFCLAFLFPIHFRMHESEKQNKIPVLFGLLFFCENWN